MKRCLLGAIVFLPTVFLMAGEPSPWRIVLPADVYKELTQRSIKTIEATAKSDSKDAAEKIAVEATILRGYTLSVKNVMADDVASLRGAALQASAAARKKDVKKLVDFAAAIQSAPKAPVEGKGASLGQPDPADLMEIFKKRSKGGEGIHNDLKYQPKLEKLDGIEALIGALGSKQLTGANLARVAKELPLLAYRIAVVGAATDEVAPKKDAAKWHGYANTMRDASIALAEAAQKKDGAGILKAADVLQNACTQCHSDFKGK